MIKPPITIATIDETMSQPICKAFAQGCGGDISYCDHIGKITPRLGSLRYTESQDPATKDNRQPKAGTTFQATFDNRSANTSRGCHVISSDPAQGTIATYGILRGSGKAMKKAKDFWYIDHGYIGRSEPNFKHNGYFRITKNALWHNGKGDRPSDRLEDVLKTLRSSAWRKATGSKHMLGSARIKPRKKDGKNIVLIPPSKYMTSYLELEGWTNETVSKIKKHTDRPIIISSKEKNPIYQALNEAWVVVTDHSNAAIDALMYGLPIIMTNPHREYGKIEDIEDPLFDLSILNTLCYNQWTIAEIKSGKAWRELNE